MYEIARLASQTSGLRARLLERRAAPPRRRAAARRARRLAPGAAGRASSAARRRRVPCCSYHSTPTARSSSCGLPRPSAPASSAATKYRWLSRVLCPRSRKSASRLLLTKLTSVRHRSMILHLTMAMEVSGSTDCGWRAGLPSGTRRAASAMARIVGDHSDGGSTCVNVRSCFWRALAAIVASLVVGPAATATPEKSVGRDGRVHPRPGAAEPQRDRGSATTCTRRRSS